MGGLGDVLGSFSQHFGPKWLHPAALRVNFESQWLGQVGSKTHLGRNFEIWGSTWKVVGWFWEGLGHHFGSILAHGWDSKKYGFP